MSATLEIRIPDTVQELLELCGDTETSPSVLLEVQPWLRVGWRGKKAVPLQKLSKAIEPVGVQVATLRWDPVGENGVLVSAVLGWVDGHPIGPFVLNPPEIHLIDRDILHLNLRVLF
jgi:hypothetical protein